jgi:signal transduction histidine kinase
MEPINLENLFKDVCTTIKLPQKINLKLDFNFAPEIKADATFLRRVLTNLINNAIQAMPDGGTLEIGGYKEDNYACITITDTGVGIDETAKSKVFTPMFTTKAKGQGLGLAVVKRLIEAQGGIIGFDSTVGKGTKFYIKLPIELT